MEESSAKPLSGRRAEAARNDGLIMNAAREVFTTDPGAPISAVAERAGVGISALYRRYESKEVLLRQLSGDGQRLYIAETEAALADQGDPWQAFAGYMRRVLEADTHTLTLRLAGTFTPTEELIQNGIKAHQLTQQLLERTKAAGVLRLEIEVGDLTLMFEQLAAVRVGDRQRTEQLRHRYLTLFLESLRMSSAPALPGPAPHWEEIERRWHT